MLQLGIAKSSHQRDILLPIDLVGDGRTHASAAGLNLEQLLALIGGVCEQPAIVNHLEDQVTGCGDGSTTDAAAARGAPDQFMVHRIPGFEDTTLIPQEAPGQ